MKIIFFLKVALFFPLCSGSVSKKSAFKIALKLPHYPFYEILIEVGGVFLDEVYLIIYQLQNYKKNKMIISENPNQDRRSSKYTFETEQSIFIEGEIILLASIRIINWFQCFGRDWKQTFLQWSSTSVYLLLKIEFGLKLFSTVEALMIWIALMRVI